MTPASAPDRPASCPLEPTPTPGAPPEAVVPPAPPPGPFPTLDALQEEHARLLDEEAGPGPAAAPFVAFVRRAAATGAGLRDPRDRWAAQSLIDYWATVLSRYAGAEPAKLAAYDPLRKAEELADDRYPYPLPGREPAAGSPPFFAQPAAVADCLARLRDSKFLAVVGPPGCGRASFVRGELIPAMERGSTLLPGCAEWAYPPPLAPGGVPAVARAALPDGSAVVPPAVVVVFYLEDIFTRWPAAERDAYLAALRRLVGATGVARVVVVLRRGFEQRLAEAGVITDLGRSVYPLPPAGAADLAAAVRGPAAQIGLEFEPGLVERIVADVVGHPTPVLLLQFILAQLWRERDRNVIRAAAYAKVGRHQAVEAAAERAYAGLASDAERTAAQRILLRLVRPGLADGQVVAAGMPAADLAPPGDVSSASALAALADAGLVRVRADGPVEVVHPALIFQWRRFEGWLREEREGAGFRALLATAVAEWKRQDRSSKALWRGDLLAQAAATRDRTPDETEFILAGQAAQAKTYRRQKLGMAAAIVALGAIVGLLIWVNRVEHEKAEAASAAEKRQQFLTDVALSRQLASRADNLAGGAYDLALLLALEGTRPHQMQGTAAAAFADDPPAEAVGSLARGVERNPRLAAFLHGHDGPVFAAAYSRDGTLVASGGADKMVRVWRADAPAEPPHVLDAGAEVRCLAFGRDVVVAGTAAGTVKVWEARSLRPVAEVPAVPANTDAKRRVVRCLAFDPAGTRMATGGWDGCLRLWDVHAAGEPQPIGEARSTPELGDAVTAVAFSPDGATLAAGGTANRQLWRNVQLWAVKAGGLAPTPTASHQRFSDFITAIAYSPDGEWLASACGDGSYQVLRAQWQPTGTESPPVPTPKPDGSPFNSLAFSPDGTTLAAAENGRIRLFRRHEVGGIVWKEDESDPAARPLAGHGGAVWAVAFRPRPYVNAFASAGGAAAVVHAPWADGGRLVTAGADGRVILWDLAASVRKTITVTPRVRHNGRITAVALSPDGHRVASSAEDGKVLIWDTEAWRDIPVEQPGGIIRDLSFDPAQRRLAGIDEAGTVWLWADVRGAFVVRQIGTIKFKPNVPIAAVAFSRDGKQLAAGGANDADIHLWAVEGEEARPLPPILLKGDGILALGFAARGGQPVLTALTSAQEVRRWVVAAGAKPEALPPFPTTVKGIDDAVTLAVSVDGRRLAVGTAYGYVYGWNLDDAEPRPYPIPAAPPGTNAPEDTLTKKPAWKAHDYRVRLAFTPNGHWLASASTDGKIGRWDVSTSTASGQTSRTSSRQLLAVAATTDADGRTVFAAGGDDVAIRVWHILPDRLPMADLPPAVVLPRGRVLAAAFRPVGEGRVLAAALDTGEVVFWDADRLGEVGRFAAHRGPATGVAFAPDGSWLATVGADGQVVRWDAAEVGRKLGEFATGWKARPYGVAVGPDGATLAAFDAVGDVTIWDVPSGRQRPLPAAAAGDDIDGIPWDQRLALFDAGRGRRRELTGGGAGTGALAFRPGGGLAVARADNAVHRLELPACGPAGDPLRDGTGRVRALAFTPDGGILATGRSDYAVRLWDTRDFRAAGGRPLVLRGHEAAVAAVAFSADGRMMASADDGGHVLLWHVAPGGGAAGGPPARATLLLRIEPDPGAAGRVDSLTFDRVGRTLAWVTAAGRVGLQDVDRRSWEARAGRVANRTLSEDERARFLPAPAPP